MPTSAPGSRSRFGALRRGGRVSSRAGVRGFTLIELMVVVAIVALAAGIIALAVPDSTASRLEQDGARLAVLLEGARVESRSTGQTVVWVPSSEVAGEAFRFVGLPVALRPATAWLDDGVTAQVLGNNVVTLGPDAILPAQRILLRLDDRRLEVATDGLGPFAVATPAPEAAP